MLSDQLKALKNQKNLTAQEIADRSGIPVSTVNKILSGQTDSPSFRTVSDIIKAMGGSVDELTGNGSARVSRDPLTGELLEQILAPYKKAIETKNKWILRLFIFSCALIAIFMIVLLFDISHATSGWFQ